MKALALALRFLLELAALAALVAAGVILVDGWLGWLLGLAAATLAAVAWGLVVAPKARLAVGTSARFAVELAVFAAATLGLVWAGRPVLAAWLAGLYVVDRLVLGLPLYDASPR